MNPINPLDPNTLTQLSQEIKIWGKELGFDDVGITDVDLSAYESGYFNWIEQSFHGNMDYMVKHGTKRTHPSELEPGTLRVISCRMNYFDLHARHPIEQLQNPNQAYISRYALNKDYHKLIRKRLQQLANKITKVIQQHQYRAFCDSAPVLERPLAEKSGLGFIGKNSLVIHPRAGSYFFLAELYTNLPLPIDTPFTKQGCGPCTACLQECPTQAIVKEGVVDATRCISYLTIEYTGIIEESLRHLIGNRLYGCDDCQLVCPWNKFTEDTTESAFKSNAIQLDNISLLELIQWTEIDFLKNLAGSPIRRIGYQQWQRNLCITIGNAPFSEENISVLEKYPIDTEMVQIHQKWAIQQQLAKKEQKSDLKTLKTTRPGHFAEKNKPAIAKKYYLPSQIKLNALE